MSKKSYLLNYDLVRAAVNEKYLDWIAIYSEVESLVREQQFNKEFRVEGLQHLLVMVLFTRTLSNTSAAMLLAEHGYKVQCETLLRTGLESLFSLVAIANNPKMAESFAQASERELKRRVFKSKLWSQDLKATVESRFNTENFKKVESIAKSTKAKSISTEEMAKAAGLHDLYLTAYTLFSGSVHVNIKELEKQFVLNEDDSEIVGIQSGAIINDLDGLYLIACEILLKSLEAMEITFHIDTKEFRSQIMERLALSMQTLSTPLN